MCNLYRMTKSAGEVAQWFEATEAAGGANLSSEIYPGYPGMVLVEGELRSMTWGFPLTLKSKKTGQPLKPKPVNNSRSDKLDTFMWRKSFESRRCLIPVSSWAEAVGPKGSKTRTWMGLPELEVFSVAGIWRKSDEWGHCYSMVMTEAAGNAAKIHNRMPVILTDETAPIWQSGSAVEAASLCVPWIGALSINRTDEAWTR